MVDLILVDDDQDDIYFFVQACKKLGDDVNLTIFNDGIDICNYFRENKHGRDTIVLLDLNMPKVGGIEALRVIRQEIGNFTTPILVYTTSKHTKDIEDSYRLGANSYIKKLDNINELAEFLGTLLEYWTKYNRTE